MPDSGQKFGRENFRLPPRWKSSDKRNSNHARLVSPTFSFLPSDEHSGMLIDSEWGLQMLARLPGAKNRAEQCAQT